jgi:regulator of cell morphogenesis and NO signaling
MTPVIGRRTTREYLRIKVFPEVPMNAPSSLLHTTLADLVTADARIATVFDRVGLDYCCHGYQTLQDAAIDKGLALSDVIDELNALEPRAADHAAAGWTDLGALTRYIMTTHHLYVREMGPQISAWLEKLTQRHGARHPELTQVRQAFDELSNELFSHMMKEENILFPYIDALAAAARSSGTPPRSAFGTILNPIRVMETEHQHAGDVLERLQQLTHGYQPPADGCTTYRLCYRELARFQADLHRHVHLENNVLFPRAIALEDSLT